MRVAGTGPEPMILGSTPAMPQLTIRAIGFRLRFCGFVERHHDHGCAAIHNSAGVAGGHAAVVPNAGFSLRRLSIVVSGRRRSSSVNISPEGSPLRLRSATGVNSS